MHISISTPYCSSHYASRPPDVSTSTPLPYQGFSRISLPSHPTFPFPLHPHLLGPNPLILHLVNQHRCRHQTLKSKLYLHPRAIILNRCYQYQTVRPHIPTTCYNITINLPTMKPCQLHCNALKSCRLCYCHFRPYTTLVSH
jgi:hypothetical protein